MKNNYRANCFCFLSRRLVLTILGLLVCVSSFVEAKEITVGLFIYNIDTTNGACSLTGIDEAQEIPAKLFIPASVDYNGVTYNINFISGRCFSNQENIESIVIEDNYNENSTLTIYSEVFSECANLKSIDLPSRLGVVGNTILKGCPKLEYVISRKETAPGILPYDTTDQEYLQNVTLYVISEDAKINYRNSGDNEKNSFWGQFGEYKLINELGPSDIPGLEEPEIVPEFEYNINDGTVGIKKLINKDYEGRLKVPATARINEKEYLVNFVSGNCFEDCKGITEIIIGSNPNVEYAIGAKAFLGCTSLRKVEFPSTLNHIYFNAFEGCENLKTVVCPSEKDMTVIKSNNVDLSKTCLYVNPDRLEDAIQKNKTDWLDVNTEQEQVLFGRVLPIGSSENVRFDIGDGNKWIEFPHMMVGHKIKFSGCTIAESNDGLYEVKNNIITINKPGGLTISSVIPQVTAVAEGDEDRPHIKVDGITLTLMNVKEGHQIIFSNVPSNNMTGCTVAQGENGTYTVTVTDPENLYVTTNKEMSRLDEVKEPQLKVNVKGYTVEITGIDDNAEIRIVDMQGRQTNIGKNRAIELPAGLYVVSTPYGAVKVRL